MCNRDFVAKVKEKNNGKQEIFAGMLAAALTFGLVLLGCENGIQKVEGASIDFIKKITSLK